MKLLWLFGLWMLVYSCGGVTINDHLSPKEVEDDLLPPRIPLAKTRAYLLVDKQILNKYAVASAEMVVQYRIFNVGSEIATEVHLRDEELEDQTKFRVMAGLTNAKFWGVLPGTNISHTVVVQPLISGSYNLSAATISYQSGQDEVTYSGTTSEPGEMKIYSTSAFHRLFSAHYEEWIAFAMLTLPCLLIPYMLWFTSNSIYENLLTESAESLSRKKKKQVLRERW